MVVERLQFLCPSAAGIFKKEEKESGVNEIFPKMRRKARNPSVPEARTRLREASQASQAAVELKDRAASLLAQNSSLASGHKQLEALILQESSDSPTTSPKGGWGSGAGNGATWLGQKQSL